MGFIFLEMPFPREDRGESERAQCGELWQPGAVASCPGLRDRRLIPLPGHAWVHRPRGGASPGKADSLQSRLPGTPRSSLLPPVWSTQTHSAQPRGLGAGSVHAPRLLPVLRALCPSQMKIYHQASPTLLPRLWGQKLTQANKALNTPDPLPSVLALHHGIPVSPRACVPCFSPITTEMHPRAQAQGKIRFRI